MKGSSSACTAIVVRCTAAGKVLAGRLATPTFDVCPRGTQWHRLQCARQCAQTRSEDHQLAANANQAIYDRTSFRSGDADLDRFFHQFARQHQFRHHLGVTYVAVEDLTR